LADNIKRPKSHDENKEKGCDFSRGGVLSVDDAIVVGECNNVLMRIRRYNAKGVVVSGMKRGWRVVLIR
jgi:hypothetical protein